MTFLNSFTHQTSVSRITKPPGTFIAAEAAVNGAQVTCDTFVLLQLSAQCLPFVRFFYRSYYPHTIRIFSVSLMQNFFVVHLQ